MLMTRYDCLNRRRLVLSVPAMLVFVPLTATLWQSSILLWPAAKTQKSSAELEAQLSISSNKTTYRIGETIVLTIQVINTGTRSFYLPPTMDIPGPYGGVEIAVLGKDGARTIRGIAVSDCAPGCADTRDVVSDIRQNWILLRPNYLFGIVKKADFLPMSRGTYTITATTLPPVLDSKEIQQLQEKDIPVLVNKLRASDITIKILD